MKRLNIDKIFIPYLKEIKRIANHPYIAKGYIYNFIFLNGFTVNVNNLMQHYNRYRNLWDLTIYKDNKLYFYKLNKKGGVFYNLTEAEVNKILLKVKKGEINEPYN